MAETKWTKGDWKVRETGTASAEWAEVFIDAPYYDDGSEYIVAECGTTVVRNAEGSFAETLETEESRANARLIAAAPDMYRALKMVCATLPHIGGSERSTFHMLKDIEAVLASARGEATA